MSRRSCENCVACLAGEADCARDAIEILQSTPVDAVILDLSEIDREVSLEGVRTEIVYDSALRKSKNIS